MRVARLDVSTNWRTSSSFRLETAPVPTELENLVGPLILQKYSKFREDAVISLNNL